jgi:methionyl aminopeptidase
MIVLKSPEEIEKMRRASRIVAEVINELEPLVRPGVTTKELDRVAEDLMKKKKAVPAFKGYRGYPAVLCTSINETVVHGIPSDRALKQGILSGLIAG